MCICGSSLLKNAFHKYLFGKSIARHMFEATGSKNPDNSQIHLPTSPSYENKITIYLAGV